MKRKYSFFLLFLVLFLSGCADLAKGSRLVPQTIRIDSIPSGANVNILSGSWGRKETIFKCQTPCHAPLKTHYGEGFSVRFDKEGYGTVITNIISKESGWCFIEKLIPIIGWIGYASDEMSGACSTLIPRHIKVILEKQE
ncbi:MAG: hypothetical protein C4533_08225 [Candidatus Omnitrophota bacterium]|jgi:hypothetical protein|nr:MAG: hypothetical protein C4533_08225 [Candidatus Omnitrophota bacterium]